MGYNAGQGRLEKLELKILKTVRTLKISNFAKRIFLSVLSLRKEEKRVENQLGKKNPLDKNK